ncbi:MAG: hypothetical protein QOF78_2328 [Phycisphaerales bacterium]|jgi:hypothetical protein|nr:hypothetical protein [Phycisphaerales bacterium]
MIASPFAPVAQPHPPKTAPPAAPFELSTPVIPRACNLLLIANRGLNQEGDFRKVARFVRDYAPEVRAIVAVDGRYRWKKFLWTTRPTFVFSAVPMKEFAPRRGIVFEGNSLAKSEEYAALDRAGIAYPRYRLLTEENPQPKDLAELGQYVVLKPDRGGRGALIKIVRSGRARWEPAETRIAGESDALIAQEFIYTGPWPLSYRVTTLFGRVLWSLKVEADHARAPLPPGPDAFRHVPGVTVVSNSKRCVMSLNDDEEIIRFAERAHAALPQIPLLGVDVIRDATTGKLYIVELNSSGYVWHFSSELGRRAQKEFGFSLESQFDGLRKAAHILADKARELAV